MKKGITLLRKCIYIDNGKGLYVVFLCVTPYCPFQLLHPLLL